MNAIIVRGYEATVIAYQLSIDSFVMYQIKKVFMSFHKSHNNIEIVNLFNNV